MKQFCNLLIAVLLLTSGITSFAKTTAVCDPPTITCEADAIMYACNANAALLTLPAVSALCPVTGNGLNFDGIDDVAISSLDVSETAYTTEMWFKTTTADCGIFSVTDNGGGGHDRHIFLSAGNIKVRTYNDETIGTTGTNYADGNWHHVAHVLGAGGQKIYVDGNLKAIGIKTYSDFTWQTRIKIGYSADVPTHPFFTGTIDEVRVWNVVRTQAQIQANMNFELNALAGLQVVYHFNQGTAGGNNAGLTTATDASGNGVSGLLFAFALTGSTSNWVDGNAFTNITVTNDAPVTFPLGNTTVVWTATDANGSTTCNQLVTVLAAPATPVITPAGATTCVNSAVLNTGVYQGYLWSNGSTTASITTSRSGNYTVQGIIDGCLSATSAPQSVTINPLTAILPSGSTSICNGSSVTLSGATKRIYKIAAANLIDLADWCGGSGSYTNGCNLTDGGFSWSDVGSSPPVSIQIKFSVGYESLGGSFHTTTLNGNAGSTFSSPTNYNDCGPQSGLITLNFNTAGYVVGGTNTLMVGNNDCWGLVIDAATFGGAYLAEVTVYYSTSSTYAWSTGATTQSINVSTAGTYTVTETDGNGCTGTANQSVTVNPLPTVTVAGTTPVCAGSPATLTASGAATYVWSPSPLALDNVASSKLAVGLHKLRTTYTGSALQLRRASDNATQDFGFTGNDLNTAAIATWLGGSDGFCTILYDQSGNGNNVTQATTTKQPLYVANGMNGKPILRFTIAQRMFNYTNFPAPFSVIYGAKQTGPVRERVLTAATSNWLLGWWGGSKGQAFYGDWVSVQSPPADNNPYVYSGTGDGTLSTLYENSNLLASNIDGLIGPDGIGLNGGYLGGSEFSDCEFTDVYVFNTVLTDNDRNLVESSIGTYYNIPTTAGSAPQITVFPTATTTYTVTGTNSYGCSATTSQVVTIIPNANPGTISGTTPIAVNAQVIYTSNGTSGGTWSSSNTSVALVNANTGLVIASSAGTSDIIYTVTGVCGSLSSFKTLTVISQTFDCYIANDVLVSPNVYQFDVYIKSTTGSDFKLRTFQGTFLFSGGFAPASGTAAGSYVASSTDFTTYYAPGTIANSSTRTGFQIGANAVGTCGNANNLVTTTAKKIGTFRYTSTVPFGCGTPDISMSLGIEALPAGLALHTAVTEWPDINCGVGGSTTITGSGSYTRISPLTLYGSVNNPSQPSVNAGTVSGTSPMCLNATTTYTSSGTTGGTWASTNTTVAMVNPVTGVVNALVAGTTNITYTVTGCFANVYGPVSAFTGLTVSPNPTAGTVSGTSTVCTTGTTQYSSNGTTGGTWSSSNITVATVNAGTGVVTALTAGTSDITYTVTGCNGPYTATGNLTAEVCSSTLNMKMFIEGFYLQSYYLTGSSPTPMNNSGLGGCLYVVTPQLSANPLDVDYVIIKLMNPVTHAEAATAIGTLKTNGTVTVTFTGIVNSNSYYLKVTHRNAIETWSAAPVQASVSANYDFTDDVSKAYGYNMSLMPDGKWAFFSGDISDDGGNLGVQDGVVEGGDYSSMENAVVNTDLGYVVTDITGDGVAESLDYSIIENNVVFTSQVRRPW